jgi:hypothetical protein
MFKQDSVYRFVTTNLNEAAPDLARGNCVLDPQLSSIILHHSAINSARQRDGSRATSAAPFLLLDFTPR